MPAYLPVQEAIRRVTGQEVSTQTCWKYWRHGLYGVKLKAWKIAGRRFTTEDAVADFMERASQSLEGQERKEHQDAEAELDELLM